MPLYEYACQCGNTFERVLPVAQYNDPQWCHCGAQAKKIITRAPFGSVQRECRYDSPIDGRPITSWAQRRDDLARNACQEYDPGMKQDAERFRAREEARLEASVDSTVEATIESWPSRKREQLQRELDSGVSAAPERGAAPFKTVVTPTNLGD